MRLSGHTKLTHAYQMRRENLNANSAMKIFQYNISSKRAQFKRNLRTL